MSFDRKEYMKEYRLKNKEKFDEYAKNYREKNKEKIKEYKKQYYLKHKDKLNEINRKWAKEHPEARKKYYETHKEQIYKQQREYQKKNKKRYIELCNQSRKRRVERLRTEGVKNAWDVVNYGKEPKYEVKKLYELPEKQNIKLYIEDKIIIFDHIDGFYSYCWLEEDRNKLVHIKATTLFKKYKDGYKYIEELIKSE